MIGPEGEPIEAIREPNGETEIVREIGHDGREVVHVEGPFHVGHGDQEVPMQDNGIF